MWIDSWKVPSDSSDKVYTVAISDKGTYGCSCPAWTFMRKKDEGVRKECKHIRRIREQQNYAASAVRESVRRILTRPTQPAKPFIPSQPVIGRLFTFDD